MHPPSFSDKPCLIRGKHFYENKKDILLTKKVIYTFSSTKINYPISKYGEIGRRRRALLELLSFR
jgi:hypothetical protein